MVADVLNANVFGTSWKTVQGREDLNKCCGAEVKSDPARLRSDQAGTSGGSAVVSFMMPTFKGKEVGGCVKLAMLRVRKNRVDDPTPLQAVFAIAKVEARRR